MADQGDEMGALQSSEKDVKKVLKDAKTNIWDEYEAVGELGHGSFATVILARPKDGGHEVAIKKILKERLVHSEDRKMVATEARILNHVATHSNIVRLIGQYEDRSAVYLVLECCPGGDMFTRLIDKGRFSEKDAAALVRTMLEVVKHCHNRGVIHRDLKPDNFLFDKEGDDGLLKTTDFGLSCFFSADMEQTRACGTPTYIAPEVIKNKYNAKADIWSIGVILYIMLSGKLPFYGNTEKQCLRATLKGQYSFTHPVWRNVSDEAKNVIRSMLTYDASKRPGAAELLENRWVKGETARDEPLSDAVRANIKRFTHMNELKKRAMLIMAKYVDKEELARLRKMFQELDKDDDGAITLEEMKDTLRESQSSLTDDYFDELLNAYDLDGDGVIDYNEFCTATSHLQKLVTADNMRRAFEEIDEDKSGSISVEEIMHALKERNCDMDMAREIVRDADKNDDGEIDYDEFIEMMQSNMGIGKAVHSLRNVNVEVPSE